MQQKLKKEVTWTWTPNSLKIAKNFKKMYKNRSILTLPNEGDDLTLETKVINDHWSIVFKIKEGEKLCKYCRGSFNKAESNYPIMEKEILIQIG